MPKLRAGPRTDITGVFVDGVKQEGVSARDILGFDLPAPDPNARPALLYIKSIDYEKRIVVLDTTPPEDPVCVNPGSQGFLENLTLPKED